MSLPLPSGIASILRAAAGVLRRPAVIAGEVIAFGAASAAAASLPQQPDAEDISRFAAEWPSVARVTTALRLHDVLASPWFLAVVSACLLSLVAVQLQQWARVRRAWAAAPTAASLRAAPFRREAPLGAARAVPERARLEVAGRAALLGSPLFHLGLLILMAAGLARAVTFRDAVARLFEGQAIDAARGAFDAERGGWLSWPLVLPRRVALRAVQEERYGSGALKQLSVRLALGGTSSAPAEERSAAVNTPVDEGPVRIYVTAVHGIAALVEIVEPSQRSARVVLLEERSGEWRGGLRQDSGVELRLRATSGARPGSVELRALSGGMLLGVTELAPGGEAVFGEGLTVRLHGLPLWAQLRASRDPSRPLFFVGAIVVITGVLLMFSVVRVDSGVFVEGDRLVVALRPHRFAPLFAERFDRLCREWLR